MKSIRRIVRAIDMRSKKVARDTGLTIPQIVILHAVKERGMVTTAALSKHADLSAATTVTILDKLESRGLVTRQRSATDRRIVHTTLTEKGVRSCTRATHFRLGVQQAALRICPTPISARSSRRSARWRTCSIPTSLQGEIGADFAEVD